MMQKETQGELNYVDDWKVFKRMTFPILVSLSIRTS